MSSSLEKVLPYGPKGPEANVIVAKGVVNVSFDKKVRSDDVVNAAMAAGHRIPDPYACSGLLKPDIPAYSWTYLPKSPACYAQEQLTATAIPPRQEVILTTQSTDSGFDWGLFCCLPLAAVVIGSVVVRVLGGKKEMRPQTSQTVPRSSWDGTAHAESERDLVMKVSEPGPIKVVEAKDFIWRHGEDVIVERRPTTASTERTASNPRESLTITDSAEARRGFGDVIEIDERQGVTPWHIPSAPPKFPLNPETRAALNEAARTTDQQLIDTGNARPMVTGY